MIFAAPEVRERGLRIEGGRDRNRGLSARCGDRANSLPDLSVARAPTALMSRCRRSLLSMPAFPQRHWSARKTP